MAAVFFVSVEVDLILTAVSFQIWCEPKFACSENINSVLIPSNMSNESFGRNACAWT